MTLPYATPPKDKNDLLARIRDAHTALLEVIAPLSPEALSRPGPGGAWSVKDHLIHLADWRYKTLALAQGRGGHEGLRIDQETYRTAGIDAINAVLYQRSAGRNAAEALQYLADAHQSLLDAVMGMDEAGLQRPFDPSDPSDTRRLIDGIISNTYEHDLEHREWIIEQLKQQGD